MCVREESAEDGGEMEKGDWLWPPLKETALRRKSVPHTDWLGPLKWATKGANDITKTL